MTRFAWRIVILLWVVAVAGAIVSPVSGASGRPGIFPGSTTSPSPSPTPVGPEPAQPPPPVRVTRIVPDPFSPNGDRRKDTTKAVFRLSEAGEMMATVHRQSGRRVRFLARAPLGPGRYFVKWDGRGNAGGIVRPGIYVIRIRLIGADGTSSRDGGDVWLRRR